ncbi:MAG: hypothetical protein COX80_04140 [Candidatus Magasanikbacteria bacterium CG_4_10_14_0_2_um_filter_33_14]|uniref:Fibrobacter succinogenes major paralogous domain-containing protein n=1 Tax=Candidatus Magasanikbacteria bacterium CG_4_10_14_0_2_um_filter_33_14 TaxID=1974636 RepID=A0A2M7V9J0_9BACT|nr:MAG: hypothetical protein COX80_04140 [Candidatus Magasanikbacteria bacterium CG_4_10_14_0_2_um_filter_33_14]
MKNKTNQKENISRVLKDKEFIPLRLSVIFLLIFVVTISYFGLYKLKNKIFATDYSWTQSDWSAGEDQVTTADYNNNATNWTKYYSASSSLTIGNDISLSFDIATSTDTTDTNFNSGTTSTVFVSSTGSSASLVLLKPGGASCTTDNECSTGGCSGGLCVVPPCAGLTSLDYSGQTYGLVEIGTQCWFAEHLNVGTKLASGSTMPSNNSIIEKWCYSNSTVNCTTYGGLYTWAEANQLAATCNTTSCILPTPSQGICPAGWHIPTDDEIKTLEVYLGMCTGSGAGCVDAIGYRGTDQGTQLKSGGTSGFNIILSGLRNIDGSFLLQNTRGYLWSASEGSASYGWYRFFDASEARVNNSNYTKTYGFPVRCLKD